MSATKTNLFIIYGGKSAEHDVSLKTAWTIIHAADRTKYTIYPIYVSTEGRWSSMGNLERRLDHMNQLRSDSIAESVSTSLGDILQRYFSGGGRSVVFPVIHGTNGEDGTLQGLLEMLDLPYVGNGVLSSAVGMDKVMTKEIVATAGILQAPYRSFRVHEWEVKSRELCVLMEREIGYPCYVKPANLGSSIGISRCADRLSLVAAIEEALKYDRKVVVEQEIVGREIQLAVIGNDQPVCSVAGEFVREQTFFDYDEKYTGAPLTQRIPAQLSPEVNEKLCGMSLNIFRILNGSGLMRIDFFLTDRDKIYFNEVNTLPGFTQISMFPILWNKTDGTVYAELIDKLIDCALERYEQKQRLQYVHGGESDRSLQLAGRDDR